MLKKVRQINLKDRDSQKTRKGLQNPRHKFGLLRGGGGVTRYSQGWCTALSAKNDLSRFWGFEPLLYEHGGHFESKKKYLIIIR